jgi:hypothetical protein
MQMPDHVADRYSDGWRHRLAGSEARDFVREVGLRH